MSNLVIPDGGNIGSASDTDAIAISSGGNVTLSQTLDGGAIGSAVTMSANQACVKTAINASGSAPIYACRAWVNFSGSSGSGTNYSDITIRGSGNVSSITDKGVGNYEVNFTTAMPDVNYCVGGTAGDRTDAGSNVGPFNQWICPGARTTSKVFIGLAYTTNAFQDTDDVSVLILR